MKKITLTNWKHIVIGNTERQPAKGLSDRKKLYIENEDDYYSCSLWRGECKITPGSKYCRISINAKVNSGRGKIIPAVLQYNGYTELSGEYLINSYGDKYEGDITLFDETDRLKIEFMFFSYGKGNAEFTYPECFEYEEKEHRVINIATAYFKRRWYKDCEKNMELILKIIDNAGRDENKPDILCFTETTYDRGVAIDKADKFIGNDSEALKRICVKAREYKMHIIFGYHEKDEKNNLYNTAVIISDKGDIIGKYRKTHLCYDEIKQGMIPGSELPVFELPFGKIGILICWDQWFPEAARELVSKGAEIIFIPTGGFPECITRSRARENGVFVVAAGATDNKASSFITDRHGDIIASVEDEERGFVSVRIDLDSHEYLRWLSFERGYGTDLYRGDRRYDLYDYFKKGAESI